MLLLLLLPPPPPPSTAADSRRFGISAVCVMPSAGGSCEMLLRAFRQALAEPPAPTASLRPPDAGRTLFVVARCGRGSVASCAACPFSCAAAAAVAATVAPRRRLPQPQQRSSLPQSPPPLVEAAQAPSDSQARKWWRPGVP